MSTSADTKVIEVFWQPGCSSCLRTKEFMEKTGIDYVAVNMAESPERREQLAEMGLGVPSVLVGNEGVPGLDLVAVAKLIGYDYTPPSILAPAALKDKYDLVNQTLCRLMAQIPPEGLEYKSPDRDRTLRRLCGHAASIMRSFVRAYDDENFSRVGNNTPPEVQTTDELIAWAEETRREFDEWWDKYGYDDPLDRVVQTYWGYRLLHECLERATWETAQHTRQIAMFIENLGITPDHPLTAEDIAGLPMPEHVQA